MWELGQKIRKARKKRGLTLKQLAESSQVSVSFLSEVERGLSQASLGSLRRISRALGISLLALEEGSPAPDASGAPAPVQRVFREITDVTVVRRDRRKKLAHPGQDGFYELVTPDLNRNLEVLFLRMEPGFDSGPEPIVDQPGEKCLLILAGCLDFSLRGQTHRLDQGDSVSYPADTPLSFAVVGDEPVECLIIITPPGF